MPKGENDTKQSVKDTTHTKQQTKPLVKTKMWGQKARTTSWPSDITIPLDHLQYPQYAADPKPNTIGRPDDELQDGFMAAHCIPLNTYKDAESLNAVFSKRYQLIPKLIDAGGNVNVYDLGSEKRNTAGMNLQTLMAASCQAKLFEWYMEHENLALRLNPFGMDRRKSLAIHYFAMNRMRVEDGCVGIIGKILNHMASLIEPNATQERKNYIKQRLTEVPNSLNGDTMLTVAVWNGNIKLLRWLDANFNCDYTILGHLNSQLNQWAFSALAAACCCWMPDTKYSCLECL